MRTIQAVVTETISHEVTFDVEDDFHFTDSNIEERAIELVIKNDPDSNLELDVWEDVT